MQTVRVLHIIGPLVRAGAETLLVNVLRRLEGTGVEFSFTAFPERPGAMDDEVRELGGELVPLPLWTRLVAFIRALKRELRSGRYDVAHAHHPEFAGYMLKYARQAGIGARFLHIHNTYERTIERGARGLLYRTLGRRRTLRNVTRGIAVSAAAGDYVLGPGWKRDPRYTTIHCGIDLEPFRKRYDRLSAREELRIPAAALVVGHVGRFSSQKNHMKLLDIAACIVAKTPETRLLLVGDGPLRPQIETRARELGIGGKTVFAGVRSDVPRMLAVMDVFPFPSLYEGLPLALVEAQAAGVPVVMSGSVTSEAIVMKDGVTVKDLDAPAAEWARACREMAALRDPDARAGLEAVRRTDFNADVAAAKLVEEYKRAIAQA
ncbi:MAG: glycosyltransferase [Planctomycetota bacterium]